MEMAVEEMRLSRSEHANKQDPMVGAVLVDVKGHVLGKAHRGKLREGDHAEFTLIERLLRDRDLDGTTLYVTLEPCTTRQPPKSPCAKRVVSARIKRVFIGMLDPNPDIQGHGVNHLQDRGVEVDFFDLDLNQQIRKSNEDFIEQYRQAQPELPEEGEREGPSEKEKELVHSASVNDLSPEVIREYLAMRRMRFSIPSVKLWGFLQKNGFVGWDDKRRAYVPTVAGLLLFGRRPEDALVQSKVKVEVHKGTRVKAEDISGPLLKLPDKIKAFLEEYGPTYTVIRDFKRVEEPEYPWDAIREALVNAIVHRDYQEGARVSLQLLHDRLIIKSPGAPLRPLTLAKIRAYNALPYSRNPRIADTFSLLKLMEERGWGLGRMRDILKSHGFAQPQFNLDSGYFVVSFTAQERTPQAVEIDPALVKRLDHRQKRIVDLVRKRGRISRAKCISMLNISRATATRDLSHLVKIGLLEAKGKGAATYYVLTGS